jgi:hypothetical protein
VTHCCAAESSFVQFVKLRSRQAQPPTVPGGSFCEGRVSDDEKLLVEACMNCKNYIPGLCLHLNHWVEADDWCGAWERLERTVESNSDL